MKIGVENPSNRNFQKRSICFSFLLQKFKNVYMIIKKDLKFMQNVNKESIYTTLAMVGTLLLIPLSLKVQEMNQEMENQRIFQKMIQKERENAPKHMEMRF